MNKPVSIWSLIRNKNTYRCLKISKSDIFRCIPFTLIFRIMFPCVYKILIFLFASKIAGKMRKLHATSNLARPHPAPFPGSSKCSHHIHSTSWHQQWWLPLGTMVKAVEEALNPVFSFIQMLPSLWHAKKPEWYHVKPTIPSIRVT